MGCEISYDGASINDFPYLEAIPDHFTTARFNELRCKGSIGVNQSVLYSLGKNCHDIEPKKFPNTLEKCCFICVNSVNPKKKESQIGNYCDAIVTAQQYKKANFDIYYIDDCVSMKYFTFLRLVLSQTKGTTCIYFSGFCIDIEGENKIVFKDELVPSKRFSDFLSAYKNPESNVHIIFDLCHIKKKNVIPHSTFFCNNLTPNTVFITLDFINNTDYDQVKEIDCDGYLTLALWKSFQLRLSSSINELKESANRILESFGYNVYLMAQDRSLFDSPLLIIPSDNETTPENSIPNSRLVTNEDNSSSSTTSLNEQQTQL